MVIDVAASLPQHVDEHGIILTVQWNVLRQLWTEAEVRDANHAAPRSGTFNGSALRLRRLNIHSATLALATCNCSTNSLYFMSNTYTHAATCQLPLI